MAQTLRMNLSVPGKTGAAAQPTTPAPREAPATRAAGTTRVKAPITGADRVSIIKAAGGFVVEGTIEGGPDGWKSEQAIASTAADRDALVTEMLGE